MRVGMLVSQWELHICAHIWPVNVSQNVCLLTVMILDRRAGTDVGEILQATQRLAHAQSERQATACRLLPPMHWALLYTIGSLFVSTFILFETGGSFSNEGRHILFTVLCGLMSFVLCVSPSASPHDRQFNFPWRAKWQLALYHHHNHGPDPCLLVVQALRDLADPVEGVYNATALLETRLAYLNSVLEKHRKLPGRLGNPSPAYLYSTTEVVVDQPAAGSRQRPLTLTDEPAHSALPVAEPLIQLATSAANFVAQTVPLLSVEGMPKPFEGTRADSSESSDSPADAPVFRSSPPAFKESASSSSSGNGSSSSNNNGSSRSSDSNGVSNGSTDLFAARPQRYSDSQQQSQPRASFNAQPSWAWDRPQASYQGSNSQPPFDVERDTYDGL